MSGLTAIPRRGWLISGAASAFACRKTPSISYFSDFDYVEMVADLERDPDAIAIGADPYTIIRPEGRWHRRGVLEKSANRAATQPSVITKR